MPSPSDLIKKANSTEYVIHAQSAQRYKNPAYYMQPPTANASMRTGEPIRGATRPGEWSAWPQIARPSVPEPALVQSSQPVAPEGYMDIRPPEIPRQFIPQKHSIYADVMKKHDRFGPRYLK